MAVADRSCTPEEFACLEAELRVSAEARRIFRETFVLEGVLETHAESELAALAAEQTMESPVEVANFKPKRQVRSWFQFRWRWRWAWGFAVALLTLAGLTVVYRTLMPGRALGQMVAAPNSELTINGWERSGVFPLTLHQRDHVNLQAGVVQINLSNGLTGFISGPAQFVFKDELHLNLKDGVGRFHAPPGAVGFSVDANGLKVKDLGTIFGVVRNADPDVPPQLHVFKGKVEAASTGMRKQERTLVAGEAVSVRSDGEFTPIKVSSRMFYKTLPNDLPYLYIPFNRTGRRLRVEGTYPGVTRIKLMLPRSGVQLVAGIDDLCARFNGGPNPIYSDWSGILGKNPRTVCAWIRQPAGLPFRQYQSIVGWGDPTIGHAAKSEMLLYRNDQNSPALLRYSFDQFLYTGTTPLDDGKWHHVAAVYRGPGYNPRDAVELYVDGHREKLNSEYSEVPTNRRPPSTKPRLMQMMIGYTPLPYPQRGFRGEIDDIYIFEAALKPARIRALAKLSPSTE